MAKKVIKIIPTKVGTAYSPTYAYQLLDYIVIDSVTVYICKRVDPNTMTSVGHPLTNGYYAWMMLWGDKEIQKNGKDNAYFARPVCGF